MPWPFRNRRRLERERPFRRVAPGSGRRVQLPNGLLVHAGRCLPSVHHVLRLGAMSLAKTVAQNLYSARTSRKLSQAALAKAAGVSVSYISMLERGQRSPPLETLEALGKALRVSPLSLVAEPLSRRSRSRGR